MPLWIVATPIGTLDDLSPRARRVLAEADVVYAEDTRVTRRLLSGVDVSAPPLRALHAHNEHHLAEVAAARALEGDVVLVSDAGTPGWSDPGRRVIEACHRAGVELRSVPGPSAVTTAVAASGFPAAPSCFLGFAPRKGRASWARRALSHSSTVVLFEAPTRVAALVAALTAVSPEREAALCRELSKRHEEVLRLPLGALSEALAERTLKGECVLVVGPGEPPPAEARAAGNRLRDAASILAERWGVGRREAYQALLRLEDERAT